jgi:hypothetical protein
MVICLAPAALMAVALALWQGASVTDSLLFVAATVLAAFGAWAMGRELAPDDQASAFVALAIAIVVMLLVGPAAPGYGLLVLFTVLGLVRQVNRTTGLEARISDSFLLIGLSVWVIYLTANPLFGLVACLSFVLDGYLVSPLRRQWTFALVAMGAVVVYMVDHDSSGGIYSTPDTLPQWTAALIAVVFALNILLKKSVSSVSDVGRKPLSPARVRGGMTVALIAIVQGLPEVREIGLVTAAAAGVCLTSAFRRSFTNPV